MGKKEKFRSFIFLFTLFIVYLFIFSESGLLERMKLDRDYESLKSRITGLENDNRVLSDTIGKYSDGLYSGRDIINSGYTYSQGKIIHFTGSAPAAHPDTEPVSDFEFELSHLRIIWIIFSVVLSMYFFTRRKSEAENND